MLKPCTTLVGGIDRIGDPMPDAPPEAPQTAEDRKVLARAKLNQAYAAICKSPGITGGDVIEMTDNISVYECIKTLIKLGKVVSVMHRTKPGRNKNGVRHFYPKKVV
jgi:hypothetical protein